MQNYVRGANYETIISDREKDKPSKEKENWI